MRDLLDEFGDNRAEFCVIELFLGEICAGVECESVWGEGVAALVEEGVESAGGSFGGVEKLLPVEGAGEG